MLDGSTLLFTARQRLFGEALACCRKEMTKIDRAQVISCLPSTRGVKSLSNRSKNNLPPPLATQLLARVSFRATYNEQTKRLSFRLT
jgi:hypothetical protein